MRLPYECRISIPSKCLQGLIADNLKTHTAEGSLPVKYRAEQEESFTQRTFLFRSDGDHQIATSITIPVSYYIEG